MGSFIVCSPCNFCPRHVSCAFSVGKVKKKQKKKNSCAGATKSRAGVAWRPVPSCLGLFLLLASQSGLNAKLTLLHFKAGKYQKNRRPPIKQTMKRNRGRKRRGDLHVVASLCARRYLYSLSNERGRCRCRRISAVRRGDAAFWRMREFPQKHQHNLTPKTMLTWI